MQSRNVVFFTGILRCLTGRAVIFHNNRFSSQTLVSQLLQI